MAEKRCPQCRLGLNRKQLVMVTDPACWDWDKIAAWAAVAACAALPGAVLLKFCFTLFGLVAALLSLDE